jgi:hypothetical protein
MTTQPWHVEEEYAGDHFVGYVLKNGSRCYERDGAVVTWLDEAKAEVDCALLNAGVGDG